MYKKKIPTIRTILNIENDMAYKITVNVIL